MILIISNIICLLFVVACHEYGHYYFAKKYGVVASNFSAGFGFELFNFTNKEGTRFSLRGIPFGGYVTFPGEEKALKHLSKWQRIKIYFGGPLANLILCIVAGLLLGLTGSLPIEVQELPWYWIIIIVILGTMIIFVAWVPITMYFIAKVFLSPVKELESFSGPIGIITEKGPHTTDVDSLLGGPFAEMVIFIYFISLALGTFNLLPLSFLDGSRILAEFFSRFKRSVEAWQWGTSIILLLLIAYIIGTDIYKLFR